MGWKGTIRSIRAAARAAEREEKRRQRELLRRRKAHEKEQELAQAAYEVEVYENHIELMTSLHKECISEPLDWQALFDVAPPLEPQKMKEHEEDAQLGLKYYKPGLLTKIFGREAKVRERLTGKIEAGRQKDERIYQEALAQYHVDHKDWTESHEFYQRILSGDSKAYSDVINEYNPFKEISELGSELSFSFDRPGLVGVDVKVHGQEIIPKEMKSLLRNGKLSVKQLPKGRFFEIYQDYICSAVLRIAGELFSLLPLEMVIVTAKDELLNTKTGHMEEEAVLSVAIPEKTLRRLNLVYIDPSDSMDNFVHRMDFKKTKGFSPVQPVAFAEMEVV